MQQAIPAVKPVETGTVPVARAHYPASSMTRSEKVLVGTHLITAFIALSLGLLMGPFQTFHRSPGFINDIAPALAPIGLDQIPIFSYYYQALTAHGVLNALVFTTFFIIGFTYFITQRSLQRELTGKTLAWVAYAAMLIGVVLVAGVIILEPQRSAVLFTFYPPMIAPALFYVGLTLVVVGSWIGTLVVFLTYRDWRRDNAAAGATNVRTPLAVFAGLVNYMMWVICSIPVAIEVLFMLLPASLGIVQYTDPQFARVLFWFFGHPLVYFWLLPAYISWYTMLPKQAGAKLFSEPLAKVAFLFFLAFSIPTGVHHMFSDPGVSATAKGIHTIFTFMVAVPSFMTAFNLGASLEMAGRKNGAKGLFDWLWKQKWTSPVVAAQLVGMMQFLSGGITGLVQASAELNITLHNTSWIPGHFHQTLGGAVTMTYIGIMYWMWPMITGRRLLSNKVALAQIATWFLGMVIFGFAMGEAGLSGVPRRALTGVAPYLSEEAKLWLNWSAIAGAILFISVILLYINFFGTPFFGKKGGTDYEVPIQTAGNVESPMILERWGLWLGVVLVLILVAWGPVIVDTFDLQQGFNIPRWTPMGAPYR